MTRNWRISVVGAFFALVVVMPAAVTFYTDWLWFGETGYREVFVRKLTAQGTLGGSSFQEGLTPRQLEAEVKELAEWQGMATEALDALNADLAATTAMAARLIAQLQD